MKIDKIEIYNLASIEGEQVIDFTQEPLKSAGLFAITGNTGTGKSTILDAICVALYNEAPRLGNKEIGPKNANDDSPNIYNTCNLLRRGTTQGYSKVTFSLSDGAQFQAVWGTSLNRNGKPRPIERQLLQLKPRQSTIADGNKAVQAAINSIVKLDYNQFTRTVILAQNSFTNFLSAKRGEKSMLLEKITGTELYADISRLIFLETKEAEKAFNGASEHMQGISKSTLNDDDLKRTQEDVNLRKGLRTKFTNEQNTVRQQLEWYDLYEEAMKELDKKKELLYKAQQAVSAMYDQQRELERYDALQPFAPTYINIKEGEKTILRLKNQTSEKEIAADELKHEVDANEAKQKDALARQVTAQQTLANQQPNINRGRNLEGQLSAARESLKLAEEDLKNHEDDLSQRRDIRNSKDAELQDCQKRLTTARLAMQTIMPHQSMIRQIEVVRTRMQKMDELRYEIKDAETALEESNRKLTRCKERDKELLEEAHKLVANVEKYKADLLLHEQANKGLSSGDIQVRLNKLNSQSMRSNDAISLWKRIDRRFTEISNNTDDLRRRKAENTKRGNEIPVLQAKIQVLNDTYEQIHRTYTLSQSEDIKNLRQSLKEGSPCPVCGSTHHPYHSDSVQHLGTLLQTFTEQHQEAQKKLTLARIQLEDLIKQFNDEKGRLDVETSMLERITGEQEEDIKEWQKFADLDQSFAVCNENVNRHNRHVILHQILDSSTKELEAEKQRLNDFNKHQEEINRINAAIRLTQQDITENERLSNEVNADRKVEETRINNFQNSIEKNKRQLDILMSQLDPLMTISGWKDRWRDSYEAFDRELLSLQNKWDDSNEIVSKEEKTSFQLQQELQAFNKAVEDLENNRRTLMGKVTRYQQLANKLQDDLRTLFGNNSVDEEATRLYNAVETANNEVQETREALNNARQAYNRVEGEVKELRKQCAAKESQQQQLRTRLDIDISQFNIGEDSTLQYFELDKYFTNPQDWSKLRAEINALKTKQDEMSFKVDGASQAVAKLDQSPYRPSDSDPNDAKTALLAKKEELVKQINDNDAELRTFEYQIQAHKDSLAKMNKFRPTLETARSNYQYWDKLCKVLGSADGKTFREIAQCYTFDFLVDYANHQLADLTSRYQLRTRPGSLMLEVIDRNMLDQVRPVNSLSGGESFIVSLALALGLSSLSSNNLEIGSLFIDEGFGNLDQDNLNMVIDALSNLQNTQRRKVGVISHTEQIMSRISPKIHLVPESGGKSRITLQG